MGQDYSESPDAYHCPQIGAVMTKIDSPEGFSYSWRIDMVPQTICNFATQGSAYGTWESQISVYRADIKFDESIETTYATSGQVWHAHEGIVPDSTIQQMNFRIRNDSQTDMQTIYFHTDGAFDSLQTTLVAAGSLAAYLLF